MKRTTLIALLLTVAALSTRAQVSEWVAYNDHIRGANTGPNVTTWNIFGTAQSQIGSNGFLTNVVTGAQLPVTLVCSNVTNGITGGGTSSGPRAGTPASLMFSNYIDFGSGVSNHAVQLSGASKIVHAFAGLDPGRLYSWHGTATRGGDYANRWTLVEISAASWTDAHTLMATGVFTTAQIPSLTSSQAVFNSGENRAPGVLVGWTNIAPNADGTILIYQTTFRGTLPAGFSSGGTYGYAMMADRLEEFTIGEATAVAITNEPQSTTVAERGRATFSLMATGSPQYIQWYRSDDGGANYTAIPNANGGAYSIASVVYPGDNDARFRATVTNSVNSVTSSAATLTVLPDTNGPVLIRAVGLLDTAYILLSFSEPLDPDVIDTGSFFLYESTYTGDPTLSPYNTFAATLTNQTNILLQTAVRDLTRNYRIYVGYVQDNSYNHNSLDPVPTDVPLRQTLPLIGFDTNNVWKYSTETNLFGTGWETIGYDDTGATWLSGPAGLGLDASVNGVPIRTTTAYAAHSEPQFFRRHFNFPASTNGAILSMRHVFEDGAVVFINGREAGRYNVSAAAVLSVTTRAAANQTDPTPISGPVPLPLTNVYSGDNVIAVVVIQSGATSSDCELAIELTAEVETIVNIPPSPRMSVSRNPGTGEVTISWTLGGTLQQATDLQNGGATAWGDVPGNPSSPYTFTPPTSGNTFFRVR